MAAPRRLAADDIVPMRMALAADVGLLSPQFCHRDDLGRRLRATGPRIVVAEPHPLDRDVVYRPHETRHAAGWKGR